MNTALMGSTLDTLSGAPVFAGTRVPVKTLTDCLGPGGGIDAFLDDFPTVTRDQVIEFLDAARTQLSKIRPIEG